MILHKRETADEKMYKICSFSLLATFIQSVSRLKLQRVQNIVCKGLVTTLVSSLNCLGFAFFLLLHPEKAWERFSTLTNKLLH